ncbi:MAG: nitroreductase family protein [archaeon]
MSLIGNIIKGRRSISEFENRELPRKTIDELVEMASWAPSTTNTQPWFFLVFDTEESKERLNWYIDEGYKKKYASLKDIQPILGRAYETMLRFFHRYGKFDEAPVYMLVFAKPYDKPGISQAVRLTKDPQLTELVSQSVKTSVAMAMQNLLLEAYARCIGTRVKDGIKIFPSFSELKQQFYAEFDIDPAYELVSGIQLGYPTQKSLRRKPDKRRPLEEIRRYV